MNGLKEPGSLGVYQLEAQLDLGPKRCHLFSSSPSSASHRRKYSIAPGSPFTSLAISAEREESIASRTHQQMLVTGAHGPAWAWPCGHSWGRGLWGWLPWSRGLEVGRVVHQRITKDQNPEKGQVTMWHNLGGSIHLPQSQWVLGRPGCSMSSTKEHRLPRILGGTFWGHSQMEEPGEISFHFSRAPISVPKHWKGKQAWDSRQFIDIPALVSHIRGSCYRCCPDGRAPRGWPSHRSPSSHLAAILSCKNDTR